MDLHLPASCNACASFHRKPSILRRIRRLPSINYPRNSSTLRYKTTFAELQTPAASVTGQNGSSSYSPTVPSHKVTVHDRQRGAVYEFYVPEVCALRLRVASYLRIYYLSFSYFVSIFFNIIELAGPVHFAYSRGAGYKASICLQARY